MWQTGNQVRYDVHDYRRCGVHDREKLTFNWNSRFLRLLYKLLHLSLTTFDVDVPAVCCSNQSSSKCYSYATGCWVDDSDETWLPFWCSLYRYLQLRLEVCLSSHILLPIWSLGRQIHHKLVSSIFANSFVQLIRLLAMWRAFIFSMMDSILFCYICRLRSCWTIFHHTSWIKWLFRSSKAT